MRRNEEGGNKEECEITRRNRTSGKTKRNKMSGKMRRNRTSGKTRKNGTSGETTTTDDDQE